MGQAVTCFIPDCSESPSVVTLQKSGVVRYRDARICREHLLMALAMGYELKS